MLQGSYSGQSVLLCPKHAPYLKEPTGMLLRPCDTPEGFCHTLGRVWGAHQHKRSALQGVHASKAFEANPLGAKWMIVRRWATCVGNLCSLDAAEFAGCASRGGHCQQLLR